MQLLFPLRDNKTLKCFLNWCGVSTTCWVVMLTPCNFFNTFLIFNMKVLLVIKTILLPSQLDDDVVAIVLLCLFLCGGGIGQWCVYLARSICDKQVLMYIGNAEFVTKTNHLQSKKKKNWIIDIWRLTCAPCHLKERNSCIVYPHFC